jgi:hypothetical protein
MHTSIHSEVTGITRYPHAMVLRLIYIVLSPVIGFLATVAGGLFPPT